MKSARILGHFIIFSVGQRASPAFTAALAALTPAAGPGAAAAGNAAAKHALVAAALAALL